MHEINPENHNMVEIAFSTKQRYLIPLNRINDLTNLFESIKYIKKITHEPKDLVTIEEVFSKEIAEYTKPGLALRGARHKEGLTQTELANLLAIRQENLSKMEHGKRSISPTMAKRLAKILNVNYKIFL